MDLTEGTVQQKTERSKKMMVAQDSNPNATAISKNMKEGIDDTRYKSAGGERDAVQYY